MVLDEETSFCVQLLVEDRITRSSINTARTQIYYWYKKKKKNVSPPIVSFTLQTLVKTYIFRIKKRKERKKERNLRFLLQNKINNCEKMERWKFTYEIRYRYLFNEIITENFAENLAARLHPRISTSGTLFPFKYNPEANEITLGWPPPVRLANSATHLPSKKRFNKFERHDSI